MKSFSTLSLLVMALSVIGFCFMGCDGMNTDSEPQPNTYSIALMVSGENYQVTGTDTIYVGATGTQVSIPTQNAAYIGDSDQLANSSTIVEITCGNNTYRNGDSFTVTPGSTLLVTVEGYAFQILAQVVPDGRFNGELALRNRTWGDEYYNLSLHYTGSNDVLEVLVWGLTGWKAGNATITGAAITALNGNGAPTTGGDATSMTVNAGTTGDLWVQVTKVYSANIHLWVASGTMPARSTGTDLRANADFNNGSSIVGFAAPEGFTGNSIQVTITGSVFGSYTTFIGLDASGYGVEYLGEPRGTGQSYTIIPITGQGVDTTPVVVTAN